MQEKRDELKKLLSKKETDFEYSENFSLCILKITKKHILERIPRMWPEKSFDKEIMGMTHGHKDRKQIFPREDRKDRKE